MQRSRQFSHKPQFFVLLARSLQKETTDKDNKGKTYKKVVARIFLIKEKFYEPL